MEKIFFITFIVGLAPAVLILIVSAFYWRQRSRASGRQGWDRAWREIARRIAHEIKNPLTPIAVETSAENTELDITIGGGKQCNHSH